MKNSKIAKLILKITVSTILFWFLLSKIQLTDIVKKLSQMDMKYIPLIVLLIALNYVISSVRWKKLLVFANTDHVSLGYLITLYFTGSFFNNFMPTSIGGDVYKIVKLGGKINSKTHAFTATFTERFLGVLALAVISMVGAVKLYGYYALMVVVAAAFAGVVGLKLLDFLSTKIAFVKKINDSLTTYKKYPNVLIFAFVFSFVVQLLAIFSQYYIFRALGYTPPLIYSLTILPVITLAGFFIPSLNGIGVQDALYVSLFSAVGVPTDAALTASLAYHAIRLAVSLLGGLMYAAGMDE